MKQGLKAAVIGMAAAGVWAEPINVLIVDGFSNHDWKHTTELLCSILEEHGGFAVEVSTFSKEDWNPEFSRFDVVIQNCNDLAGGEAWPRAVQEALENYVQHGGGLYVFHSANNAFPDWPEYNRMIGLGWRSAAFGWAVILDDAGTVQRIPPGEGEDTGHGKRVDAQVTRIGEHPIHQGFPRQWTAADIEIYRYARGPAEQLAVLSYAEDAAAGLNFPVEWTVDYGAGRVYSSTLGHVWRGQPDPAGMRCAAHRALIPRVVLWLAKRPVDSAVPADFPAVRPQ